MNKNFLTVKEASEILEVSKLTLRNWDNSGKLKAKRHPVNNYRVYKKKEIEDVLKRINSGTKLKKVVKKITKKEETFPVEIEKVEEIKETKVEEKKERKLKFIPRIAQKFREMMNDE